MDILKSHGSESKEAMELDVIRDDSLRVMKVYTSEKEMLLFQKEFQVLANLNKVSLIKGGVYHPHMVRATDAKLVNTPTAKIESESVEN
jgi:archaellum biogenesis ATPase FlaH